MPRYVAFLRAINVGGHTVKMAQLRSLLQDQGLERVETFIASGNVVFDAASANPQELEQQIEGHLLNALGYEVATFIRTAPELAAIAHRQPFPEPGAGPDQSNLYIAFTGNPLGAEDARKLAPFANDVNRFHMQDREVYWRCRTTMSQSEFSGAMLEKALGMSATLRNSTTVRKLADKLA